MGCGASSRGGKAAPKEDPGARHTSEERVCTKTSFGKGGEMDAIVAGIATRLSSTVMEDGRERNSAMREDDDDDPIAPPAANGGSSTHVVVAAG